MIDFFLNKSINLHIFFLKRIFQRQFQFFDNQDNWYKYFIFNGGEKEDFIFFFRKID